MSFIEFLRKGDTVSSVAWKRYKSFFKGIVSPESYTEENYDYLKSKFLNKRNEYFAVALMITPLVFMWWPYAFTRRRRARNEYFMNQMLKRK
jgi:hypothetical protein